MFLNQEKSKMKNRFAVTLATVAVIAGAATAQAQVAGSTQLAVATLQVREVAFGWSARKQILDHAVVNENGEVVGRIKDLIVAPDGSVSHAIVGAGGFLGVRRHDVAVAVAVSLFEVSEDTVVLRGATRDAIKALPAFDYAR
jgi:sporulation protein YlmC with PRC-barrel domain